MEFPSGLFSTWKRVGVSALSREMPQGLLLDEGLRVRDDDVDVAAVDGVLIEADGGGDILHSDDFPEELQPEALRIFLLIAATVPLGGEVTGGALLLGRRCVHEGECRGGAGQDVAYVWGSVRTGVVTVLPEALLPKAMSSLALLGGGTTDYEP